MKASDRAFNALGDTTRRMIFGKLRKRPLAVSDIAEGLSVSRPAVSQHLKVLKEAKLIFMYKKGTQSIYQIDKKGVLAMRLFLDQFWNEALDAFKLAAEKEEKKTNI